MAVCGTVQFIMYQQASIPEVVRKQLFCVFCCFWLNFNIIPIHMHLIVLGPIVLTLLLLCLSELLMFLVSLLCFSVT